MMETTNELLMIMKTLMTSFLTVTVMSMCSCTTVVETPKTVVQPLKTTTTTTERSTLNHPSVGTTETKTTRTY